MRRKRKRIPTIGGQAAYAIRQTTAHDRSAIPPDPDFLITVDEIIKSEGLPYESPSRGSKADVRVTSARTTPPTRYNLVLGDDVHHRKFLSDPSLQRWCAAHPNERIAFVAMYFPPDLARHLTPPGFPTPVAFIGLADLRSWLESLKGEPKPKAAATRKRIGSTIRANADQIIVAAESLRRTIDDKLALLRSQRRNSDEAAEEIAEYEVLCAQVAALQDEIMRFRRDEASETNAIAAAEVFGSAAGRLFGPRSQFIPNAGTVGLVMSLATVFHLVGVNPNLNAALAAGLLGGKNVVDIARAYFKGRK